MKVEYRPYVCSVCGHKDKISTNHEGPVLHFCKGCSWKRDFAGPEHSHSIPQLGNHTYRLFTFDSSVNESRPMQVQKLRELKGKMTDEQKRRLLVGLRKFKECGGTGNVGGETDIVNPDSMVAEDEFTAATKPEPKVVAKTFDTDADFDSYIQQRRGIEMTPKEQQAILNWRDAKPTQRDKFMVKYETTDEFGQNDTTVIKKLRDPDSGQFCWTAFSKHESAEDEGKPEDEKGGEEMGGEEEKGLPGLKELAATPSTPSQPSGAPPEHTPSEPDDDDEVTVGDKIRISKSITFADETQGADILANFIQALDI